MLSPAPNSPALLGLPKDLQIKIEKAAQRNGRTPIDEMAARLQASFASKAPKTACPSELEHELAEQSLNGYNLTMELHRLQMRFKQSDQASEKQRLAIQIDELASRIGLLEAKRLLTLQKISTQQA